MECSRRIAVASFASNESGNDEGIWRGHFLVLLKATVDFAAHPGSRAQRRGLTGQNHVVVEPEHVGRVVGLLDGR